jgi:hypothetical protein
MSAFWEWAGSGIIVAISWIGKELWSIKKQRTQDTFNLHLDLEKLEHEVRFKMVFDKVSHNILELFPMITKLNSNLKKLFQDLEAAGTPDKQEQRKIADENYNNASNYLHENRLLIPMTIFIEVNAFLESVKAIRMKFNSGLRKEQRGILKENYEDYWATAADDLEKMKPKYEKIHEAMQEFLGLHQPQRQDGAITTQALIKGKRTR